MSARYDRIVITGALPGACHAAGMTGYPNAPPIRIFGFPRFAGPLRDRIGANAGEMGGGCGAKIEYIAKAHIRKEELVAAAIKTGGDHPGVRPE